MNLNTQRQTLYHASINTAKQLKTNKRQVHKAFALSLNKSIYNKCYYTLNVEWEEIKYVNSVYVLFISIKYYFWK